MTEDDVPDRSKEAVQQMAGAVDSGVLVSVHELAERGDADRPGNGAVLRVHGDRCNGRHDPECVQLLQEQHC